MEPVMVIQATLFTNKYNYRVVRMHVLSAFFTNYSSYLLYLIHLCGYFLTLLSRCYAKKYSIV